MHSTFREEDELRAEENRALWSPIVNVRDAQPNKNDEDPARARYASAQELAMAFLQ